MGRKQKIISPIPATMEGVVDAIFLLNKKQLFKQEKLKTNYELRR